MSIADETVDLSWDTIVLVVSDGCFWEEDVEWCTCTTLRYTKAALACTLSVGRLSPHLQLQSALQKSSEIRVLLRIHMITQDIPF